MNSPKDRSLDDVGVSLIVGDKASHDNEHGNCLSDSSDEVKLSASSTVDKREGNTGGKRVDGRKDGSEDEGEFTFESEIFLEDRSTAR